MFQFDYQWKSKNGRWQADMYKENNCIYGSVMSWTYNNTKYSSQVGFRANMYSKDFITTEFEGSLPKYVKTEIINFCKEKLMKV